MQYPVTFSLVSLMLSGLASAGDTAGKKATDAFGISDGEDSIGIYDSSSVRGFDLSAAGNYRLNGAYFVKSSGVSHFFVESTQVRIGLAAAGMDFPGPSGVINYQLHDPAATDPSQLRFGVEQYQSWFTEAQFKGRAADNSYSYSVGVAGQSQMRNAQGGDGSSALIAGTVRYTPSATEQWQWFAGEYDYKRQGSFVVLLDPNDQQLPDPVARGRYLGQAWANETGQRRIAGTLYQGALNEDWTLHSSLVFSQDAPKRAFTQLFQLKQQQSESGYLISPSQRFTAWSGEVKAVRTVYSGEYQHRLVATLRGRHSDNRFGGDRFVDTGSLPWGDKAAAIAMPDLAALHADSQDLVRQTTAGVFYAVVLPSQLQLSGGVLMTDYRKDFRQQAAAGAAGSSGQQQQDRLLLPQLSLAYPWTPDTLLYSSYTEGLEESGVAPAGSANPNEVLSAVASVQRELGVRHKLNDHLQLLSGFFVTEKQFAGIHSVTNQYQLSGEVRHQGLELSLTGQLSDQWQLVMGGVYTEARLSNIVQDPAALGHRAVGVPQLKMITNLVYSPNQLNGLQWDLNLAYTGERAASRRVDQQTGAQLQVPAYLTTDLGMRYRFTRLPQLELRAQLYNLFDRYNWEVSSAESLTYLPGRSFRLRLHYDF